MPRLPRLKSLRAKKPEDRIPRGALAVVGVGILACIVSALLITGPGGGEAAQLEWVQQAPIRDSKPAKVPGGSQEMRLTEGDIRATGTNVAGYSLYRAAATLTIAAGAPVGSGRIRCSVKAPHGTEIAQTPHLRGTYPRSSEELAEQKVPEVVLLRFSSHGDELAVVEFDDLFRNGFATEKGVKVEWPTYRVGDERLEWFLPPGPPKQTLELPFASVWRIKAGTPKAAIACTLTTSAGEATVHTAGALKRPSPPIDEQAEEENAEERKQEEQEAEKG